MLRNRFRLRLFGIILGLGLCAQGQTGVRVLLGLNDKTSTRWDGSVTVQGASVSRIDPWRFTPDDEIHPDNSWRAATHPILIDWDSWTDSPPFSDNGVIIWLSGENSDTQISVKTARGDFNLRLGDLSFGTVVYGARIWL